MQDKVTRYPKTSRDAGGGGGGNVWPANPKPGKPGCGGGNKGDWA